MSWIRSSRCHIQTIAALQRNEELFRGESIPALPSDIQESSRILTPLILEKRAERSFAIADIKALSANSGRTRKEG